MQLGVDTSFNQDSLIDSEGGGGGGKFCRDRLLIFSRGSTGKFISRYFYKTSILIFNQNTFLMKGDLGSELGFSRDRK